MKKLSGLLLLFLGCVSVYEFFSLVTKETALKQGTLHVMFRL
ncbi:hypothetical protein [Thermoactinomyces mirandus]|nr:hypothetical protein [Thermoactinomyces mirandus]